MSEDGTRGLTIIAFIGSVFSPYYAWARRRAGQAGVDPLEHSAINVALYGADGRRWTMTERGARQVQRSATTLRIGTSELAWDGHTLTIDIDEITAPVPARVRGTVRVTTGALHGTPYALDPAGRHQWQPMAPCAEVEVDMERPSSRWRGFAYVDSNRGSAPLEQDFARWQWSRARAASGRTSVLYDVVRRDGSELALGLAFMPQRMGVESLPARPPCMLASSGWRIARATRSDAGAPAEIVRTLEDGPFYARSLVRSRLAGEAVMAVHESLDLDRFASPWVQAMLPFRMPRRG